MKLVTFMRIKNVSHILVGPTVTGPVQDPLAVTRLENRLYMPTNILPCVLEIKVGDISMRPVKE